MSIKDRVQSGAGDEGWAIHTNGSLRYKGRVVVPQLTDLRERSSGSSITLDLRCIQVARRCTMIFVARITGAG